MIEAQLYRPEGSSREWDDVLFMGATLDMWCRCEPVNIND